MALLLDTHCWLWICAEPERLRPELLHRLQKPEEELILSAASSWEISIKHAIGKLELPDAPDRCLPDWMARSGVTGMPIAHSHAIQVAGLPHHHRDPFDRLLVAQAQVEGLSLVTADRSMELYEVDVIWAT